MLEIFFSSLKKRRALEDESTKPEDWPALIFDYIKIFYNRNRRHVDCEVS